MKLEIGNRFAFVKAPRSTLGEVLGENARVRSVAVNGRFVDDWRDYRPRDDDRIVIQPQAGIEAIITAIIGAIINLALSAILNALMPKPKKPSNKKPIERFGVAGLSNTIEQGTPIPTHWGTWRTFPHIIGSTTDISEDGRQMTFSVLYLVGWTGGDGYKSMSAFLINDVAIGNYKGASVDTRLGALDQSVIPDFTDVKQVFFDGREIPHQVEIQSVEIKGTPTGGTWALEVPNFGTTAALAHNAPATDLQTALRAISGLASVTVTTSGISPNVTHSVAFDGTTGNIDKMKATDNLVPKKAKIKIDTVVKGAENSASPIVYTTRNQVDRVKIIFSSPGLYSGDLGKARVEIKVEKKLNSDPEGSFAEIPESPIEWHDKSLSLIHKQLVVDLPSKNSWDFRLSLIKSTSKAGRPQLFNMVEIEFTQLNYPGYALCALRGLASHQIQSLDSLRFSLLVEGKKHKLPDGQGGFNLDWSDERLWICRDVLTHPTVGLGHRISEDMYDDVEAETVQDYLDELVSDGYFGTERRDICNLMISELRPGWDYIRDDILGEVRAALIPSGRKLKPVIDRQRTPNLTWQYPGNIVEREGGPVQTGWFYEFESRINTVRAAFWNQDAQYKTNTIEIQDAAIGSDPVVSTAFQFDTITRETQARREITVQLKRGLTPRRRFQFNADGSGQVSEPMDVDNLAYSTANNARGFTGFVPRGSYTTLLLLDRHVELESGKTYEAILTHRANNVIEKRTIATAAGKWGKVVPASPFATAPAEGDLWSIGEQNVHIKPIIIQTAKALEDGDFELSAVEYIDSDYNEEELPAEIVPIDPGPEESPPPLPAEDGRWNFRRKPRGDGSWAIENIFDFSPGLRLRAGIAQGGTASTFILNQSSPPRDDTFNGARLRLIAGTGAGQERTIVDYVGATRTATVDFNFDVTPSTDTEYEIEAKRFGAFGGFVLEESLDGVNYTEIARPQGTHFEMAVEDDGISRYYRLTPYSTAGVENATAPVVLTATTTGDTEAPVEPQSVTISSHFKTVSVDIALALPLEEDFAGLEMELWKTAIGGAGTLIKDKIAVAVPSDNRKSGADAVKKTFSLSAVAYGDAIFARARSLDTSKNESAWVNTASGTTLAQIQGGDIPGGGFTRKGAFFGEFGVTAPTPNDGEKELASLTITSTGELFTIGGWATVNMTGSLTDFILRLRRDNITGKIIDEDTVQISGGTSPKELDVSANDARDADTYTYSLTLQCPAGRSWTVFSRRIKQVEFIN